MNLIPDRKAAKKCGVCAKTLERWDDKQIGFPPIIRINDRKFRDADLLDEFLIAWRGPRRWTGRSRGRSGLSN
jgi:hypothetical protein